jgi:hypothetical protein
VLCSPVSSCCLEDVDVHVSVPDVEVVG